MKLLRFRHQNCERVGLWTGAEIVDISALAPSLDALLYQGEAALRALAQTIKTAKTSALTPDEVTFLPPIAAPQKILCLGLNFAAHADEVRAAKPSYPVIFARVASSLIGHGQSILRPRVSTQLDFEGELAVIIGRAGRHVPRERALDHVAGYSVFNDGSVRDYQFKSQQWTIGKNFDRTGAFGPYLVTADEVPPGASGLMLETRINGEVMQGGNTRDMLFNVAETIALVTEAMTLVPGDVLVMGTPAGVGFSRNPPVFLRPGDVCEVSIEGIGTLRNAIADEAEHA